jgi:hypothetical protein
MQRKCRLRIYHLLAILTILGGTPLTGVCTGCSQFGYDPFDLSSELLEWNIVPADAAEHFTYRYQADPTDDDWSRKLKRFDGSIFDPATIPETERYAEAAAEYAAHFEAWYGELAALFDREPVSPIRIYNYVDKEQQVSYTGGRADMYIDYAPADGGGIAVHMSHEGVCAHELVHIFQSSYGNPPGLLMEGMAVALAGAHWEGSKAPFTYVDLPTLPTAPRGSFDTVPELAYWQNYPLHKLAGHVTGVNPVSSDRYGEIPSREDLRPSRIMYWGSGLSEMWYVYCLGGSFVHYLVQEHGWDPFLEVYRRSSSSQLQGESVEAVFSDVYGSGIAGLEEQWLEFLHTSGRETVWGPAYWAPGAEH